MRRRTNAAATSTRPRPIIDSPPVAAVDRSARDAPLASSPVPPVVPVPPVDPVPPVEPVEPVAAVEAVLPVAGDELAVLAAPELLVLCVAVLDGELLDWDAGDDDDDDDDDDDCDAGVLPVARSSRSPGLVTTSATPATSTTSAAAISHPIVLRVSVRSSWSLERATGIEPAWPAWKAGALPLSYARAGSGEGSSAGCPASIISNVNI